MLSSEFLLMISLFCCMCLRLTAWGRGVRRRFTQPAGDEEEDGQASYESRRSEVCWWDEVPCTLLDLLVVVIAAHSARCTVETSVCLSAPLISSPQFRVTLWVSPRQL